MALAKRSSVRVDGFDPAALKAGDHGLGGSHALGDLLLREVGLGAGADEGVGQGELLFQRVAGLDVGGVLAPLRERLLDGNALALHRTSFARARAISMSRRGVFCVFLRTT